MTEKAKNLGERIRIARGVLTQQQLSDAVGVSETTIRNWEMNRVMPLADSLAKIASVTRCDASWLLTGAEPPESIHEHELQYGGLPEEVFPGLRELLDDDYECAVMGITDDEKKLLRGIRMSGIYKPDKEFFKKALIQYRLRRKEEGK